MPDLSSTDNVSAEKIIPYSTGSAVVEVKQSTVHWASDMEQEVLGWNPLSTRNF